jgi:hypothetical protein
VRSGLTEFSNHAVAAQSSLPRGDYNSYNKVADVRIITHRRIAQRVPMTLTDSLTLPHKPDLSVEIVRRMLT